MYKKRTGSLHVTPDNKYLAVMLILQSEACLADAGTATMTEELLLAILFYYAPKHYSHLKILLEMDVQTAKITTRASTLLQCAPQPAPSQMPSISK